MSPVLIELFGSAIILNVLIYFMVSWLTTKLQCLKQVEECSKEPMFLKVCTKIFSPICFILELKLLSLMHSELVYYCYTFW